MNWKHIGKLLAAGAVLLLGVGWGPAAFAQFAAFDPAVPSPLNAAALGTAAGTSIDNDATLNFRVDTIQQTAITTQDQGTTASFLVDRRLNVNVTESAGPEIDVNPGEAGVLMRFTVTNLSNATIDIPLAAAQVSSDFTVDPTVNQICIESAVTSGTCDGGAITSLQNVAQADVVSVLVLFNTIDLSNAKDELSTWTLVAAMANPTAAQSYALPDSGTPGSLITRDSNNRVAPVTPAPALLDQADVAGTVQNVFADAAGLDRYDFGTGDALVASAGVAREGQHSARLALRISAPEMSISKSSRVVWDPVNGGGALVPVAMPADPRQGMFPVAITGNPKRIPGAIVEYTITVGNALGSATADNVEISDAAPTSTSPVGGTSAFGTAIDTVFVDVCDANGTFVDSGQTVTNGFTAASLGNCAAGQSGTVIFYVEIN